MVPYVVLYLLSIAGIFKAPEEVDIYVDVKGISDLHKVEVSHSSSYVG